MSHAQFGGTTAPEARESREERGSALVLAVFVLVLLTSMGSALLFLSENEMKMSQADLRSKKAFFLAEGGLEDARTTLWHVNRGDDDPDFDEELTAAAGANGVIDVNPAALAAVFDASGQPTGFTGYGDDVPVTSFTAVGEGYYAAVMTNDPPEGVGNLDDENNRVMVYGMGTGRNRSFEVVQAVVLLDEILPSIPPATITMLGPSPHFDGANSKVHRYEGNDCDGAGIPGLYMPVVGLIGTSSETSAEAGVSTNPDYSSGPYIDADTFADLTDPTEPTVVGSGLGTIGTEWQDCQTMHDMVEALREVADKTCPSGSTYSGFCVNDYDYSVLFVDGDFDIGPVTAQGTIVVTGALTIDGNTDFGGVLVVVGKGVFGKNGSGNGVISGASIIADVAGPDNVYGNADDCSTGFGQASYDEHGGGNADMIYCSEDIISSQPDKPLDIVDFRQR
ncbi:MAG TPA: PilX N-terminal domain-containing pilus assembly protein [Candidatus Polarisedimenticolaceae bacterium]|nr:PilX N-terminal domain-containing pilus assembly protein [Candidatus Polarisedimenticolaceae bacterium]